MKKLLLVLLGFVVIFFIAKKFGFFSYLFNYPSNTSTKTQSTTGDTVITQAFKPIIGIHYRMIEKQTAAQNGLAEGAYITQIIKDSPAEKAGLKEEDIITEIDGRVIAGLQQQSVYNLISTLKPGSQINLKIWRNKEIKTILVTLEVIK